MNLYLISQDVNTTWDTYESAVVAAEAGDDARLIHPMGREIPYPEYESTGWAHPEDVTATFIGVAVEGTKRGVILASCRTR